MGGIGWGSNQRDLICKDRMWPEAESACHKWRDALVSIVCDDKIRFAVAGNGKRVVDFGSFAVRRAAADV
jgi:hypothetical protein